MNRQDAKNAKIKAERLDGQSMGKWATMKMNEQRLEELAEKLKAILKEYEVGEEGFQLKVFASQSYYDSIKENFSKRNPLIDVVVGTRKDDWEIDVMYLPTMPTKI